MDFNVEWQKKQLELLDREFSDILNDKRFDTNDSDITEEDDFEDSNDSADDQSDNSEK